MKFGGLGPIEHGARGAEQELLVGFVMDEPPQLVGKRADGIEIRLHLQQEGVARHPVLASMGGIANEFGALGAFGR